MLNERDDGSYEAAGDPGEPTTGVPRVSITDDEGTFLAALVHGKTVLEIGTGLAVSTRYLASTAEHVTTVDPDAWVHDHIWPGLFELGNVTPLASIDDAPGTFDVVFIDGSHRPVDLHADIAAAEVRCDRGVIVAHDAVPLAREFDDSWQIVPTTHGLAVRWIGWD